MPPYAAVLPRSIPPLFDLWVGNDPTTLNYVTFKVVGER